MQFLRDRFTSLTDHNNISLFYRLFSIEVRFIPLDQMSVICGWKVCGIGRRKKIEKKLLGKSNSLRQYLGRAFRFKKISPFSITITVIASPNLLKIQQFLKHFAQFLYVWCLMADCSWNIPEMLECNTFQRERRERLLTIH